MSHKGALLTTADKRLIDWDTVEVISPSSQARAERRPSRSVECAFPDRRGLSPVAKILAGASTKARGRGAPYTHVQLRRSLVGWQIFLYGWGLLGAAVASERDVALGVELAARVIEAAASLVPRPTRKTRHPAPGKVGLPAARVYRQAADWDTAGKTQRLVPRKRVPIDWDTVELIEGVYDDGERTTQLVFPDRRGRSVVKSILSGATTKARGRGAIYTHVQLRRTLVGWQLFLYGWGLLGAAVASVRDFALGVELAARVIEAAAAQLAGVEATAARRAGVARVPS